MCRAARWVVDHGATVVDINMGCPVNKVVKTGGGSALMCQADSATALVAAVVEAVDVPVTVKMRLGWDDATLSAPSLARSFEKVGAAGVIIHGRTREQGFKGDVNREGIRAVVEAVESMPVVGNGDIRTLHDAETMFRETGCAAISIGRGALSNPFLFRQLAHWAEHGHPGPEPSFDERVDTMVAHFHRLQERRGERHACFQFRKILKWYSHAIRPKKELYHRLINLDSVKLFDETVDPDPRSRPVLADPRPLRAQGAGAGRADRQVVMNSRARGRLDKHPSVGLARGSTYPYILMGCKECGRAGLRPRFGPAG